MARWKALDSSCFEKREGKVVLEVSETMCDWRSGWEVLVSHYGRRVVFDRLFPTADEAKRAAEAYTRDTRLYNVTVA